MLPDRRAAVAALLVSVGVFPGVARADGASEKAETLFSKAQECLAHDDWACACESFAASMESEASASTQFNVAKCELHDGHPARAWRTTQAALKLNAEATYADENRRGALAKYGDKLVRELEASTAELVIAVTDRRPGLSIEFDGAVLSDEELAGPFRIDPGQHKVTAKATGYAEERYGVAAAAGGHVDLQVSLDRVIEAPRDEKGAARAPADPSKSGAPPPPASAQRTAGWVLTAGGTAGLGASLALGIATVLSSNTADDSSACKAATTNDLIRDCNDLRDVARDFQSATIGLAVTGAALAGVGVVLVVTAPSQRGSKASLSTRGLGLVMKLDL